MELQLVIQRRESVRITLVPHLPKQVISHKGNISKQDTCIDDINSRIDSVVTGEKKQVKNNKSGNQNTKNNKIGLHNRL